MLDKYIKTLNDTGEVHLEVKIYPGAKRNEIKEILDINGEEVVKIDIAMPPIEGKANEELIKFLAEVFGVRKNNIEIKRGESSKLKLVCIKK